MTSLSSWINAVTYGEHLLRSYSFLQFGGIYKEDYSRRKKSLFDKNKRLGYSFEE